MNAEIYRVSYAQFAAMVDEPHALRAAKLCEDILVGMYAGEPLVFIGLAPVTILSDEVYAWMLVTDAGRAHRFLLARYARGVLDTILSKYPLVIGDCISPDSARWLRSLGAVFTSPMRFEFRRG